MPTRVLLLCLCRRRGGEGSCCRGDGGSRVHAAEAVTPPARGSLAAHNRTEALHMCRGPGHLQLFVCHVTSHTLARMLGACQRQAVFLCTWGLALTGIIQNILTSVDASFHISSYRRPAVDLLHADAATLCCLDRARGAAAVLQGG